MPSGEQIAKAYVAIEADLSKVPAGMNQLSSTVTSKILELQKKTQAQLARTQLEMKVAVNAGNMKDFDRLVDSQKRLEATMVKVNTAALNQAAALRKANGEAARVPRTPGGGGGSGGGEGGSFGGSGMGLLVLSQAVDDIQYGFRAIVNNIPQMGMALGSVLGKSTEWSMKFGGALGIAAVAVNLLITHWDDLMGMMGLGKVLTEAEQMEKLAKATKLTADEQERLSRFKREEAVKDELKNKKASGVEKTEAAVKAAIADLGDEGTTGHSKLIKGLVEANRAEGLGAKMTDKEAAQMGGLETNIQRFGQDPEGKKFWEKKAQQVAAKIQARLDKEDVGRAQHVVNTAVFDPERRQELVNLMQKQPGAFPGGAAGKIGGIVAAKNTKEQEAEESARRLDAFSMQNVRDRMADRDKENERLAGAMTNSVGQKYLANPGMTNESLQAEVKKAMQNAGMSAKEIGDAMVGTAKKIRENLDKAVKDRALDRGIKENVAQQQLLKEANETDKRQANLPKSEVMSTESYLNKTLVGALNQSKDAIPREQLTEQKTANETLRKIHAELKKGQKPGPATFARGRS